MNPLLWELNLAIIYRFHVETNLVVNGSLVSDVKPSADVPYYILNFCATWGGKDFDVHVDEEDDIILLEDTVVKYRFFVTYLF